MSGYQEVLDGFDGYHNYLNNINKKIDFKIKKILELEVFNNFFSLKSEVDNIKIFNDKIQLIVNLKKLEKLLIAFNEHKQYQNSYKQYFLNKFVYKNESKELTKTISILDKKLFFNINGEKGLILNFDDYQRIYEKDYKGYNAFDIGEPIFSTKIKTFWSTFHYYGVICAIYIMLPSQLFLYLKEWENITKEGLEIEMLIVIFLTYIFFTQIFIKRKKYSFLSSLFPFNKIHKEDFITNVFVGTNGVFIYEGDSSLAKRYSFNELKDIDTILKLKEYKVLKKLDKKYIDKIRELINNQK